MLTLLTTLLVAAPTADTARPVPAATVPIQISLSNDGNYLPGGMVNVRVQTTDDGYLIVFRVDGDGRIRVIFPLDPDADAFVRGGKEYELRGRADRATFLADDRGGNGMIYAALSHQTLVVRDFTQNGHWDYDALRLRDSTTDAENDLTAIVSRMTNGARFDYDAVGYRVQDIASVAGTAYNGGGYYPGLYDPYYNPRWRCMSCGWGYPGSQFTVGFGYSPFWDPYLFSPWGYSYGAGYGYGFGYPTYWYPTGGGTPRPMQPPGTRSRPRPGGVPPSGTNVTSPPSTYRPTLPPPSGGAGTRARPRPSDMAAPVPRSASSEQRPVFRQPPQGVPTSQSGDRPRPEPQSRPVYREPPQVYRAPPPSSAPRSEPSRSAPPSSSSAPRSEPSRSAPPPPPAGRSRPGGGGRR